MFISHFIIMTSHIVALFSIVVLIRCKEFWALSILFLTLFFSVGYHLFDEHLVALQGTTSYYFELMDLLFAHLSIIIFGMFFIGVNFGTFNIGYVIVWIPVLLFIFIAKVPFFATSMLLLLSIFIAYSINSYLNIPLEHITYNNILFWVIIVLVITNLLVYKLEYMVSYAFMHSIHHLLCFLLPGLIILHRHTGRRVQHCLNGVHKKPDEFSPHLTKPRTFRGSIVLP